MSSTAQGFLEDILAHPDDDTPRLIFADWLEDEGDSDRAEFIRVQIERARLPEWDARQVRLKVREDELIKMHAREWELELPQGIGIAWTRFHRGFVAAANFGSFKILKENIDTWWSVTPLESVSVPWTPFPEIVESLPPIPGLRELSLHIQYFNPDEVDRLANAPFLSTLHSLEINDCYLGVEGFRRLVASPHLGNLRSLLVSGNDIGNGGIDALINASTLPSLTELDLTNSIFGRYNEDPVIEAVGAEALAAWPGLARLRSLHLSGNNLGRLGLRAILASEHVAGLKEFVLRANGGIDAQAMQEFAAARSGQLLDLLDLGLNMLSVDGVDGLASAACLHELKVMKLDRCELQAPAARRLAKAPFLGSLRELSVNENNFGPEGLQAILEASPPHLHTLRMANNDLGDHGALHASAWESSNTLLELDLSQNHMGDSAASVLGKSEHLRNLLILRLRSNPFSDSAIVALRESPLGRRLAVLKLNTPKSERSEDDIPF
jgi:uncharacterized protein (TIGR02996 family)